MALNKRGVATIMLIVLIFTGFVLMLILGIGIYGFTIVDGAFSNITNFTIGNVSFQDNYQATLQPGLTAVSTTAPVILSTGILLGMILSMMFVGYTMKKVGKLWILLDIFLIIVAEVVAAAVSSNFTTLINITPEFLDIFSNTLTAGSRFIINLPIIVPVVGALIMLATHLTNNDKEEKEALAF